MRPLLQPQMLAAEFPSGVHQRNGIERAAPFPRPGRSVSRLAMEKILNGDQSTPDTFTRGIGCSKLMAYVSTENNVGVLEQTGTDVEGFCSEEFFRNSGNQSNRPGHVLLVHQFFQDQRVCNVNGPAGGVTVAMVG